MSSEIWSIKVDMPPKGTLEKGEDAGELTDEAHAGGASVQAGVPRLRLSQARRAPGPAIEEGGERQPGRVHGADKWSTLNHYLLRVMGRHRRSGVEPEEVLPPEADVMVVGAYDLLDAWPQDETE